MYVVTLNSVPPDIVDEESTLSSVAVRENQNLTLTCKARGFPAPKITWKREDGVEIVLDRKKKGNKGEQFPYYIFLLLSS